MCVHAFAAATELAAARLSLFAAAAVVEPPIMGASANRSSGRGMVAFDVMGMRAAAAAWDAAAAAEARPLRI